MPALPPEPPRIEYRIPHVTVPARCLFAEALSAAIWRAEGGARACTPYGILSMKVRSRAHGHHITLVSIQANWRRWIDAGCPGGDSREAFVRYMSIRWCPASVDPVGNANWVRNVCALLERELAKEQMLTAVR